MEFLGGASLIAFLVLIVGTFFGPGLHQYALRSPNVAAVVSAILVDLANEDRTENELNTLTLNPTLVAVAQAKANDMAEKGYFAHTSPEGRDPWYWFNAEGYEYRNAGENLAVDFSDSGDIEKAWMSSPKHRENILNEKYTEIGIAMAEGTYEGHPTTFVVQVFGTPIASAAGVSPAKNVIPDEPTELAVTTVSANEQVLGSSTPFVDPKESATLAARVEGNIPMWGYIVGFPRDTLRYAFFILGFLVLVALAFDTGLELRWHHLRHAKRAGRASCTTGRRQDTPWG